MRTILPAILAALLIASAQQNANSPQTAPKKNAGQDNSKKVFSFSTGVQLVVVDAFIKDKNGNSIPNLTAADFSVAEDGKAQEIAVCQFQELQTEALPAASATLSVRPNEAPAEVKAVTRAQIAPAASGEVKYKDKRLLVLFFDMSSMPIQDQIRAQDGAIKFVKTQITPSDLLAIMSFSGDVRVVEDFTEDRDKLIKDIKNLTIGEGQGFDSTATGDSATDTGAAFSADDSEFNIFNTDRQLSALETAVTMLGALPEKKALVYFNSGITAPRRIRHPRAGEQLAFRIPNPRRDRVRTRRAAAVRRHDGVRTPSSAWRATHRPGGGRGHWGTRAPGRAVYGQMGL